MMHQSGFVLSDRGDGLHWLQCDVCGREWAEDDDGAIVTGSSECYVGGLSDKERALASSMLNDFAGRLGNSGCNWDWPADWSTAERIEFCRAYHEWNGDPFNPQWIRLIDFQVAEFLAFKLHAEGEK